MISHFIISTIHMLCVLLQTFWEDKNSLVTFSVFLESYTMAMCLVLNLVSEGMELFGSMGSGILQPFFPSITSCSLQWIPRKLYFAFLNSYLRKVVHMWWKRMPSLGREINCLTSVWIKDMKINTSIGKYVKDKFLKNSIVLNHRVRKELWKSIYSLLFMSNHL